MDYRVIFAALIPLTACVLEPQPPGPPVELVDAPLAAFDAKTKLEQQFLSGSVDRALVLRLSQRDGDCHLMTASATATLDGVAGVIKHGGYDEGDGEWPHNDDGCINPTVEWKVPFATTAGTFVLTDGETTWSFQVDRPFVARRFELVSHPTPSVRSGDRVVLRVTPATETLIIPTVSVYTSTVDTTLYPNNGLTQTGTDLSFTMPTVAASEEVLITASATGDMKIFACDLPGGCSAMIRASADLGVEVSP